ncbi:carboxymuconolactone decarboxylase family protein [Arthrobacter sp. SDTb3-6]|uniref:carboxymuconolactone decarboxylase family protein n=1 Tax=Arthrobacter sp. SDTb3-6 TaxID=2713571 RepID=UPI00159EB0A7|nr:carboxymuconolactone decarboxylase family protein [Arthrobacter sp. SDTb3-6]NVM98150.1 carboxymuconolactone decarboxylase family protein [Arthrobacter sp. SDTb3-6]
MADQPKQVGGGQKMFGDFAPKLAVFTAGGNTEQLGSRLARALDNGLTQEELTEAITHVTLYAGWPRGMSAMGVAKQVFADKI